MNARLVSRSTKAGASTPATLGTLPLSSKYHRRAQRRPGHQPRRHRHNIRVVRIALDIRSTKAGASTPATLSLHLRVAQLLRRRSTKAGASTPATHDADDTDVVPSEAAQRRPGHQPRRHLAILPMGRHVTPPTLNEGRGINPGDTSIRACWERAWTAALNEGRGINPGDTGSGCLRIRMRCAALNEGRGINPGDTWSWYWLLRWFAALNEGRGINPGDTAKCCKRAAPRRTIARPRTWEPRRRRVCDHFMRFRTILRQNGQHQAAEITLTAPSHTRFPRITEGSQMSQSTQGWPSS